LGAGPFAGLELLAMRWPIALKNRNKIKIVSARNKL